MNVVLEQFRGGSGADVWLDRLARGLEARSHEVRLCLHRPAGQLFPYFSKTAFPDFKADIVIGDSDSAFAFWRQNIPLISMFHLIFDPRSRYATRKQRIFYSLLVPHFQKKTLKVSSASVAPSNHSANVVRQIYGIRPLVIQNGIDTQQFSPAAAPPVHSPPVVLFVGNPTLRKGFDVVLKLAERLCERIEVWVLPGLRRAIDSRWKFVKILPYVPEANLPTIYRNVNLLLLPSRLEGFPYAVLEAMACGLPVIGGRGHAIDELVEDGEGGFLVDPNNLNEVTDRTLQITSDRDLQIKFGRKNRNRVIANFSLEKMLDSYESLMQEVCKGRMRFTYP